MIDGPFTEAKEVLGGYWRIEVNSREEAIAWAKRCPASANDLCPTGTAIKTAAATAPYVNAQLARIPRRASRNAVQGTAVAGNQFPSHQGKLASQGYHQPKAKSHARMNSSPAPC